MKTTVKLDGFADLERDLGDLTKASGIGVLRRAGRKGLAPFDAAWRDKAPVDKGDLKASGGVGSQLSRSQRRKHRRESTVEVFAGPGPNPQAIQDEFGNAHQMATPFVRPAWEETKDQVLPIVAEELRIEIDKASERLRRRAARAAARRERR